MAGPAAEQIVAAPAPQGLVTLTAAQRVVEVGADNNLDADQLVPLGIAGHAGAGKEVDRYPRRAVGIRRSIQIVATATEDVGVGPAAEHIIAIVAEQDISAAVAGQGVVEA